MDSTIRIVTVDASNVDAEGFFCYKSKPKSEGYRRKREWLEQRFAEGMRIKILYEGERSSAFVEYTPGEVAWRAVHAEGYLVIHCLWVVGRGKRKGYGSRLIQACIDDAQQMQKRGVIMVASSGNWLAGKKLFLHNGFEAVGQAPPSFDLLVKRLGDAPAPSFPENWEERLRRYGPGLTVVRTDQCPYIEGSARVVVGTARRLDLPVQVVELTSAQEVREAAPSAYGVFGIVKDGRLLTYHPIGEKDLLKLLEKHGG